MAMTNINIRTDSEIKRQAQELFSQFGLDMTSAVNLFLRQALREQAIPFAVKINPDEFATLRRSATQLANGEAGYSIKEFKRNMERALATGAAEDDK